MSEAPSEEASLSDVFYIYLLLLRPRYFTNYVSFHEGLPPPPHTQAMQFLDSVSQPIIAATNQLMIYPPYLGGYLLSNFIQPVYRLSRTPVSDETPFAGLLPAISASQAYRQLSQPYRLFTNGLLLRLLGLNLSLVASDRHLDASLSRDLEVAKQSSSVLRGESRPPPPLLHSLGFRHLRSSFATQRMTLLTLVHQAPIPCCYACPARSFASRR